MPAPDVGPDVTRRRKPPQDSPKDRPGLFERTMFTFLGPPQLGENKPPDGYVADQAATLCHRCGEPWDRHARVDSGTFHYRKCPPTAA